MRKKILWTSIFLLLLTSIGAGRKWKATHTATFTIGLSGSGEVKYGSKIMYSNPISNSFTLTFGDEFGCDDLVCFSGKYRIGHLSISQLNREPRFYFSWAEMVEDTQYNYKLNGTGSWTYDRRSRIFTFISTGEYWMDRFKIVDGVGVWDHGVWYANPVFVLLGEPIS